MNFLFAALGKKKKKKFLQWSSQLCKPRRLEKKEKRPTGIVTTHTHKLKYAT